MALHVKVLLSGKRACGKTHLWGYIKEAIRRQFHETHIDMRESVVEFDDELSFFSAIQVTRENERLEVHPLPKPAGMYPVGYGKTIEEAMGNFLIAYQKQLGIAEIHIHATAWPDELNRRRDALKQR